MPAIVANRYQDVLAAKGLPARCHQGSRPERISCGGALAPAARELYVDWDEATEVAVSGLREVAGTDLDDARLRA